MRRNQLMLYVHLIWSTWDRQAYISQGIERRLYRNIESQARKLGCTVLALNGTCDHVHLVVELPATLTVADLVKQVKGGSSHFFNHTLQPAAPFKWQGIYGAFTISRWDLEKIILYVKRQKEHHHQQENLVADWERPFEEIPTP